MIQTILMTSFSILVTQGNTSFDALQTFKEFLNQNFLVKKSFLHRLEDNMFSFMVTTDSDSDDLVEVMLTDTYVPGGNWQYL